MPPSSRFRMNLSSSGNNTRVHNSSQINATINRGAYSGGVASVLPLGIGTMISRVSSARPSCGACGK